MNMNKLTNPRDRIIMVSAVDKVLSIADCVHTKNANKLT